MRQIIDRRQTWFLLILMGMMFSLVAAGCAKKVETASQTVSPEENVTSPPPPAEEPQKEERPAVKEAEVAPPETSKPISSVSLEDIHFDYDKSAIRPDVKAILEKHAKWLQSNPKVKIQIEGHCDERGTNEYNLALGERRAQATKRFLVAMGIDAKRLSTISYGEERPLCSEHAESCYSKNRRAHFVIEK
ncbi:MAG TPA: peptidoglycan-associated lipoprotein Pal [Nitrospiria bacterium]|jgi:peptidoglycan-associated lipoprotein|nr:peptidoglycan-associated lipoprotein Pal [Nitrospiria bacterium]